MIEISNLRIPLSRFAGKAPDDQEVLRREVCRACSLPSADIATLELRRRAIDARRRGKVQLVCTVRISLGAGEKAEEAAAKRIQADKRAPNARIVKETPYLLPTSADVRADSRPVVVGAGCAGLFCALALATAGLEPLLIERGDDAGRRTCAVDSFSQGGALDPESNIQFGLGGAGTFSDGKLATGTKSPAHRLILETFVAAGATSDILWDSHPHVGSDVLPRVVENIRQRIEELGGEVRCRCRMSDLIVEHGAVRGVVLKTQNPETGDVVEERLSTSCVVVASGHSARDVFELLKSRGATLERKPFAMGVRIEHLQADVDRALYGTDAGNPVLGAAPYKLVDHVPGRRSSYSFCMCPGGFVVAAASEPGGVVTNGMSLAARDGCNANSGLLCNIAPEDLPGVDPLAGVELQRSCERTAFELGGGGYVAPAQLVGDFVRNQPSVGPGHIAPTYPLGVAWGRIDDCLPAHVVATLRASLPRLGRKLRFFGDEEAVLTGVESRSSSPVRVVRGDNLQSVSIRGLYPCGEGAGYAGGIMSAATDGLRVAEAICGQHILVS